jgi:YARHG domain/TIR domain
MTMIMVSYRRADAQDMAGRIADYLISKYGENSVFFDVNSIPTGVNYHNRIEKAIIGSHVMVAVIGQHWIGQNPDGKTSRLHDPGDPVRVEIEAAMKHNKPILPLLVNGTTMPEECELPDSRRELHSYNGARIDSGQDFRLHMRRLVDSISEIAGPLPDPPSPPPTPAPALSRLGRPWTYGAGALVLVAGLGVVLWPGVSFEWPIAKPSPVLESASAAIPASITSQAKAHGGFIFPDSDQRLLGDADLKGMSLVELRLARNEIFARRGRFFVDQTLAGYFSQFPWYHPRQVDVDLSPLETTNVNTIELAERQSQK